MASQIPEDKKLGQQIRDEFKKIKSFGFKEGVTYVWDYYKVIPIGIVVVIFVIVALCTGNEVRDLVFHCSFSAEAYYANSEYLDHYPEFAGMDESVEYAYFDSISRYGGYASMQHSLWISTQQLDMIVCDADMNNSVMNLAAFYDLKELLPDDLQEELKDKFFYYKNTEFGADGWYAVDISSYFAFPEDSVYQDGLFVCIPSNTNFADNGIAFLRYIVECPPKDYVITGEMG